MGFGLVRAVRAVVGAAEPTTVYECRQCGTTLEEGADACPACGAEEAAAFDVE